MMNKIKLMQIVRVLTEIARTHKDQKKILISTCYKSVSSLPTKDLHKKRAKIITVIKKSCLAGVKVYKPYLTIPKSMTRMPNKQLN